MSLPPEMSTSVTHLAIPQLSRPSSRKRRKKEIQARLRGLETLEARRLLVANMLDDGEFESLSSVLANQDPSTVVGGLIDTFSSIREQVSTVLESAGNLPIVGDQIMAGVQPFLDDLSEFETRLVDRIDGIYAAGQQFIVGAVRDGLYEVFGPPGLNVLQDHCDDGGDVGPTDIIVTSENGGLQFDFHLGQTIFTDLEFSIGDDMEDLLPLFDFKLDASDGIRFQLGWDLYLGFGFAVGTAADQFDFYINTDAKDVFGDSVDELSAYIDVFSAPPKDAAGNDIPSNEPGITADVSLGILSAHIEDGTEKRITLTGTDPVPLDEGILAGHDFSNNVELVIDYDPGDGSLVPPAVVPIEYSSPGNESFQTFLTKLNVELNEAMKDDSVPQALRGELFPFSVRPQVMVGLDTIESQVDGDDPPESLNVPVALVINARTPLIKSVTIRERGASADLTKWGFQGGGQTDDDRAIGLGFLSGAPAGNTLNARYAAPTDGVVMGDTDFILEYGNKMTRVVIRKSTVPEFAEPENPGDPSKLDQYAEFVQERVRAFLSQVDVPQSELDNFAVTLVGDKLQFTGDQPMKITYSVLDKTGATILASIDIKDPGTSGDDGRLSLIREVGGASITDIFEPQLQASAEVRLAVDASTDAVTSAIAQAIGASDTALELPSLSFDLKVDASITVDANTSGKKDLAPEIDVKFDNVSLDIGPVLDTVVKPIANFVGETLGPVADVLGDGVDAASGFINEPIPVVSDIVGGDVSVVDLAPNGQKINDTLGTVSSLLGLGSTISSFLETYDGRPINFGCFTLDRRVKFPIPCEVTDTIDDLLLGGGEVADDEVSEPRSYPENTLVGGTRTWTINGLKPDTEYIVSGTWDETTGNAGAQYTLINGSNPVANLGGAVNQSQTPTDDFVEGKGWKEIGRFTTESVSGEVNIGLPNSAMFQGGDLLLTEVPEPTPAEEAEAQDSSDSDPPDTSVSNSSKKKKKTSSASFLEKFSEFSSNSPLSLDILSTNSVLNMLTGKPFDIISINVPALQLPIGLDFDFGFGPISANFEVGADITAELGFGYDSTGIQQIIDAFSSGADPDFGDLLDGFYVRNQVGEELRLDLTAAGGGSIGPIGGPWPVDPLLDARAQIEIGGGVGLDLKDPNEDGRLRFDELLHVTDNFRSPENMLCIFDVGLEGSFDLSASVTILGVTLGTDDLPFPTSFEFSLSASEIFGALGFDCDGRISPILAEPMTQDGENVLRINAGAFAANRLFGGPVLPEASPSIPEGDRSISDVDGVHVEISGDKNNITVKFPGLPTRAGATFDDEKLEQSYQGPFDRIILVGEEGNDIFDLSGLSGVPVKVDGAAGDDSIIGGGANDELLGGPGQDTIMGGPGADMILGGPGNDNLKGGDGNDVIQGEAGEDTIDGEGGEDNVDGGRDNDTAMGGPGNDQVSGGTGNDLVNGNEGNDRLMGNSGDDTVIGGSGADDIFGDIGHDNLQGGPGPDVISGGLGNDLVAGGNLASDAGGTVTAMVPNPVASNMVGANFVEAVFASTGDMEQDNVSGDEGNDFVVGEIHDFLFGRKGSDIMFVGIGAEWADGGSGNDILEFNLLHPTQGPSGAVSAELRSDRLIGNSITEVDTSDPDNITPLNDAVTIITGIEDFRSAFFGDGPDEFTVAGTPAPLNITLEGGDDTLRVTGTDHPINVDAGAGGGDKLVIDISADTVARSGSIVPSTSAGMNSVLVGGLGLIGSSDAAPVDAQNFFDLEVQLGQGTDNLTVDKATFFERQRFYGNGGDDKFFITPDDASFGSSKQLEVYGDDGDDVANVIIDMLVGDNNDAVPPNPSLENWGVTIDTLRIDNSGGNTAETWELRDQNVYVDGNIIMSAIGAGTTLFRGNIVAGSTTGAVEDQLIITDSPSSKKTISVNGDVVEFKTGKNVLSPQLQADGRTHDITTLSPNGYDGLANLADIASSPDGKYVYAVSPDSFGTLAVYERDPSDGNLRLIQSIVGKSLHNDDDGQTPRFVEVSFDSALVYVATETHIHVFRLDSNTGRLARANSTNKASGTINQLLVHPSQHAAYALVGNDQKNGNSIDSFVFNSSGLRTDLSLGRRLIQDDLERRIERNYQLPFPSLPINQSAQFDLDVIRSGGAKPVITNSHIYWINGNNLNSYALSGGIPGAMSSSQLSSDNNFGYGSVSEIVADPSGDKLIFTSDPVSFNVFPVYETRTARYTVDYFFFSETYTQRYASLVSLNYVRTDLPRSTFVVDLNGDGTGTQTDFEQRFARDLQFDNNSTLIGRSTRNTLISMQLIGGNLIHNPASSITIGSQLTSGGGSTYFDRGGELISLTNGSELVIDPTSSAGDPTLDSTAATSLHSGVSDNHGNVYALDPNSNSLLRFRKAADFEDSPFVLVEEFVDGFVLGDRANIDRDSTREGAPLVDNGYNVLRVDGLAGATSITLSKDGRWIYVTSPDDNKIAVLRRGLATESEPAANARLQFVETLNYTGVHKVALTDDENQERLLAIGSTVDQFAYWYRDSSSGEILGSREVQAVPGLGTPNDIVGSLQEVQEALPGLVISESNHSTVVQPPAIADDFTVALKSRPLDDVFVDVRENSFSSFGPAVQFQLTREFTVDVDSDRVVIPHHGFSDGDTVTLTSSGTLPSGLIDSTTYVVSVPDDSSFSLSEPGGEDAIILDLGTGLHTLEATVSSGYLRFTPENFSTPQTVHVLPLPDEFDLGDRQTDIGFFTSSGDPAYTSLTDSIEVKVRADEGGKLIVETDGDTSVSPFPPPYETFTVQLDRAPESDVVVDVVPSNGDVAIRPTVIFDPDSDLVISPNHGLNDFFDVGFDTLPGGSLPAEIDSGTRYNIRVFSPDAFELVDPNDVTSSGLPLDFTDAGSGTQFHDASGRSTLRFSPSNWDQPQTVVLRGLIGAAGPDLPTSVSLVVNADQSDDLFDRAREVVDLTLEGIAGGTTFVVDTELDIIDEFDGRTSLREAVIAANDLAGRDTIAFDPSLDGTSLELMIEGRLENDSRMGDLDITDDLLILGNGARHTVIDANGIDRVIHARANLQIIGATITGGVATDDGDNSDFAAMGGGILGEVDAILVIDESQVVSNFAQGIFSDGSFPGPAAIGAGIAQFGSNTSIRQSTIANNSARGGNGMSGTSGGDAMGGGLYTSDAIFLQNSTVSGNTVFGGDGASNAGGTAYGAGFYLGGRSYLTSSTIAANHAFAGDDQAGSYSYARGGGVFASSSAEVLSTNSLISNNFRSQSSSSTQDFYGSFTGATATIVGSSSDNNISGISGGNFFDVDPQLFSLADNGGPTDTIRVATDSIAIDNGITTFDSYDQRGGPRIFGARQDIGAYEVFSGTIVVDTELDSVNANDGMTSLREAIIQANEFESYDTITFDSGLDGLPIVLSIEGRGENAAMTGDLDIRDDIRIFGNGSAATIIDAGGIDRIFDVNESIFVISNVTLTGGSATDDGAQNTSAEGGAINALNSQLSIYRSVITGNQSRGDAPSVDARGGAISATTYTFAGFAEYIPGTSVRGEVFISETTISDNHAIAADGTDGVFSGDAATVGGDAEGGAIFIDDGGLDIVESTLSGNIAVGGKGGNGADDPNPEEDDLDFGGDGAMGGYGRGGAIFSRIGTTITTSTISGNSATGGDGGSGGDAFYQGLNGYGGPADGGGIAAFRTLTISASTVANNSALGGVNADSIAEPTQTREDSIGGGVYKEPGTPMFAFSSVFAGNIAPLGPDISGTIHGQSSNNLVQVSTGATFDSGSVGNILDEDPLLGPLTLGSDLTATHALLANSPAIDRGSSLSGIETDQRGEQRNQGIAPDIGAFETEPTTTPVPELSVYIAGEESVVRFQSLNDEQGSVIDSIGIQQPHVLQLAKYDDEISRQDDMVGPFQGEHDTLFVASDTIIQTLRFTKSTNRFSDQGKIDSIPGIDTLSDIQLIANDQYLVASSDNKSAAVFRRNPAQAVGIEYVQRISQPSNGVNGIKNPTKVAEIERVSALGRLSFQALITSELPSTPTSGSYEVLAPFNVGIDGQYDGIVRTIGASGSLDAKIPVKGILGSVATVEVSVAVEHSNPSSLTYQLVYDLGGSNEFVLPLNLNAQGNVLSQTLSIAELVNPSDNTQNAAAPNATWALRVANPTNQSAKLLDWALNVQTDTGVSPSDAIGPSVVKATSTIAIEGGSQPIQDVNVTIDADNIDLSTTTITVVSPSGTKVNLWTPNTNLETDAGGAAETQINFQNLTFDEAYAKSFANSLPADGTTTIDQSGIAGSKFKNAQDELDGFLREFNGEFAQGDWTLEITSTSQTVTLNSWSLSISEQVPDGYSAGFENQNAATVKSGGTQFNFDPAGADNTVRLITDTPGATITFAASANTATTAVAPLSGTNVTVNLRTNAANDVLATADEVADAINAAATIIRARVIGQGGGIVAPLAMTPLVELGGEDTVTIVDPTVPNLTINTLQGNDQVTNIKQGVANLTVNLGSGDDTFDSLLASSSNLTVDGGADNDTISLYNVGGGPGTTNVNGRSGDDTFLVHLDRLADDGDNAAGEVDLNIVGGSHIAGDQIQYWTGGHALIPDGFSFPIDRVSVVGSGTLDYSEIENATQINPQQVSSTTPAPSVVPTGSTGAVVSISTTAPAGSSVGFDITGDGNPNFTLAGPNPTLELTASQLESFGLDNSVTPELVTAAVVTVGSNTSASTVTSTARPFTPLDKGKTIVLVGAGPAGAEFVTTIADVQGSVATLLDHPTSTGTGLAYLPTSFPVTISLQQEVPANSGNFVFDYETVNVVLINQPPVVTPNLQEAPDGSIPSLVPSSSVNARKGRPIQLTLNADDLAVDGIAEWTIDWGDATRADLAIETFNTESISVLHEFVQPSYRYSGDLLPTNNSVDAVTQGDPDSVKLTDNSNGGVNLTDGSLVKLTQLDGTTRPAGATAVLDFDFGRTVSQNQVRLNFFAGANAVAPPTIQVQHSIDGQTFTTATANVVAIAPANPGDTTLDLTGINAQFIKVVLTPAQPADDIFIGEVTFNPLVQVTAQDGDDYTFITDAANNTLQIAHHGFANGQELRVIPTSDGNLPTGLTAGTPYQVANATTHAFQLIDMTGGNPVTVGAGRGIILQSHRLAVSLQDVAPTIRQFGGATVAPAANAGDPRPTVNAPFHGLSNGDSVRVLPDQLLQAASQTDFFVVNANQNDFQIAAAAGGAAIDLSNLGIGAVRDLALNEGQTLSLPLMASGPAGRQLPQAWWINWGDGTPIQKIDSPPALVVANHTYPDDGVYEISVIAIEPENAGGGIVEATPGATVVGTDGAFTVVVNNVAPELAITGLPATIDEGDTHSLVLQHSDVGDDSLLNWNIDWGDGTEENIRLTRTPFTADANTDVFTSAAHGLTDGMSIQVGSTDKLPSALDKGRTYVVSNATTDTFQLTLDAAQVDLTDTGSGEFFFTHATFQHTYRDDGVYTVQVAGRDEDGVYLAPEGAVTVNNVRATIELAGDVRRPVHFDLTRFVNVDAVANRSDDAIDPSTGAFNILTISAESDETRVGLPDDGLVPARTADVPFDVQLNYDNALDNQNAVLLSTASATATINLRATEKSNYDSLLLLANADADTTVSVTINYDDDTSTTIPGVTVPGIFNSTTDTDKLIGNLAVEGDSGTASIFAISVDDPADGSDTKTIRSIVITRGSEDVTIYGITAVPSTTIVNEGERYFRLVVDSTDPGADRITDWTIDWGDGIVETINAPSGSIPTRVHVYADDGDYTIKVSGRDEDNRVVEGQADPGAYESTLVVKVLDVAASPVISIDRNGTGNSVPAPFATGNTASDFVLEQQTFTVNLSAGDPGADRVTSFDVDFGDGTTENVTVDTEVKLRVEINDSTVIVYDKDGTRLLSHDFNERLDVYERELTSRTQLVESMIGFASNGGPVTFANLAFSQDGEALAGLLQNAFDATQPGALAFASTPFTVDVDTDTLLATGHGLADGDAIQVTTSSFLPTGLPPTSLYVLNPTANVDQFQVSLTKGGPALPISDSGIGTHGFRPALSFKSVDIELNGLLEPNEQVAAYRVIWGGGEEETISTKGGFISSVDVGDNRFHLTGHGFSDGDRVRISSTGQLPGELIGQEGESKTVSYYVRDSNPNDFRLELVEGTSVARITTAGTGQLRAEFTSPERLIAKHVFKDGQQEHNVTVVIEHPDGTSRQVILNTLAARRREETGESGLPSAQRTISLPQLNDPNAAYFVEWGDGTTAEILNPIPSYTYPQQAPGAAFADASLTHLTDFDDATVVNLVDIADAANIDPLRPVIDFDFGANVDLTNVKISYVGAAGGTTFEMPSQVRVLLSNGSSVGGSFFEQAAGAQSTALFAEATRFNNFTADSGTVNLDLTGYSTRFLRLDFSNPDGSPLSIGVSGVEFDVNASGPDDVRFNSQKGEIEITHRFTADPVQKAFTGDSDGTADSLTTVADGLRHIVVRRVFNERVIAVKELATQTPIATLDADTSSIQSTQTVGDGDGTTSSSNDRVGKVLDVGLNFSIQQNGVAPADESPIEPTFTSRTDIPERAPFANNMGGLLQVSQGAALVSDSQFDPTNSNQALVVSGQWEFTNTGGANDVMRIFTRSNGVPSSTITDVDAETLELPDFAESLVTGQTWSVTIGSETFTHTVAAGATRDSVIDDIVGQINASATANTFATKLLSSLRLVSLADDNGETLNISSQDVAPIQPRLVDQVTFTGIASTITVDDVWSVTIGAETFTHTVVAGNDTTAVIDSITTQINGSGSGLTATRSGNDISATIPANADGTSRAVSTTGTGAAFNRGTRNVQIQFDNLPNLLSVDAWTADIGSEQFVYDVMPSDNSVNDRLEGLAALIASSFPDAARDDEFVEFTMQPAADGTYPGVTATGTTIGGVDDTDRIVKKLTVNEDVRENDVWNLVFSGTTIANPSVQAGDTLSSLLTRIQNGSPSEFIAAEGNDLFMIFGTGAFDVDFTITDSTGTPLETSEISRGIEFSVSTGEDQTLSIVSRGDTDTNLATSTDTIDIAEGDEFSFLVIDDGEKVHFSLTQVGDPSNSVTITADVSTSFTENHVAFQNFAASRTGELGSNSLAGAPTAAIDNVSVAFREVLDVTLDGPEGRQAKGFAIVDDVTGEFTIAPDGILNVFDGTDPNGDWTLTLANKDRTREVALNEWELDLKTGVRASSTTAVNIDDAEAVDNGGSARSQTTATMTINDQSVGTIIDVSVDLDISHPRPEDLTVTLVSPEGTRVRLFSGVTLAREQFTLSSDANDPIDQDNPIPTFTVPVRPQGSLTSLAGENLNGDWQLEIIDDDSGPSGAAAKTLNGWSLSIETNEPNVVQPNDRYVVVAREGALLDIDLDVDFKDAGDNEQPTGLVLFDYQDATNYKYAGVRDNGTTRTFVIGHHDADGFHDDATLTEQIVTKVEHTYTDGSLQQITVASDDAFPLDTVDGGMVTSTIDLAPTASIPLGNLFDDPDTASVNDAILSDSANAIAEQADLGVDFVLRGGSPNANVNSAANFTFDLSNLGWSDNSFSDITNDGWRTGQPIRVAGSTTDQQGVGLHANSLVTFDIAQLRNRSGLDPSEPLRFLSEQAGVDDSSMAPVNLFVAVLLSNDTGPIAGYLNGQEVDVSGGQFALGSIQPLHSSQPIGWVRCAHSWWRAIHDADQRRLDRDADQYD